MSTWTSFVELWTVCNCDFNANFLTFLDLYHLLVSLDCKNYCFHLYFAEISHFNFGGKFEFRSKLSYYNCICSYFKLIDTLCFYFTTVHCHLSAGKHLCYWPWPTWSSFPCVARHSYYLLSDLASCLCWSIFICLQKLKLSISN